MIGIQRQELLQMLKEVVQKKHVLAPVKINNKVLFLPLQEGMELEWEQNSVLPPKDILFPKVEVLYRYQLLGSDIHIDQEGWEEKEILVFGLRSCDSKSIKLMDKVFLGPDYLDSAYAIRRENAILLALGCSHASSTCFCTSLGVDPMGGDGADIVFLPLEPSENQPETTLRVNILTAKGDKFFNEYQQYFIEDLKENPLPAAECRLHFDPVGIPEKLKQLFGHDIWERTSKRCLACGICTYLCPTCHCFDIQGTKSSQAGMRFRCWDSCMFSDYTLMASGHDPRPSKVERFRNRFLHKLRFFYERYGDLMCTGCGRCLASCPVHLDISYVVNSIREAETDAN